MAAELQMTGIDEHCALFWRSSTAQSWSTQRSTTLMKANFTMLHQVEM